MTLVVSLQNMIEGIDWWKALPIGISLVALLTPVIRRFVRRRRLRFITAARPEIGFSSPFGSSFAMNGSIYSAGRSSLITEMRARIKHESGRERVLKWHLARDRRISFTGNSMSTATEVAAPFKIDEDDVAQFSTVFLDFDAFREVDLMIPTVRAAWDTHSAAADTTAVRALGPRPADPLGGLLHDANMKREIERIWSSFYEGEAAQTFVTRLSTFNWWPAGRYSLVLEITLQTSRPHTVRSQAFAFTLPEDDAERIRRNVYAIVRTMAGINTAPLYAYPEYSTNDRPFQ